MDFPKEILVDFAIYITGLHKIFYESIFEGMISDNSESATGFKESIAIIEEIYEGIQFVVDGDTECLIDLCEIFFFVFRVEESVEGLEEVAGSFDGFCIGGFTERFGDTDGIFEIGADAQDSINFRFGGIVEDVGGGTIGALIHSHIERSVGVAECEASMRGIEMMEGYAEVGQDTVEGIDAVEPHEIGHVSEIGAYESETRVGESVGDSVGILIETVEVTVGAELAKDSGGMSAATESSVGINTVGFYVEGVDSLAEESGGMIGERVIIFGEIFHF